MPGPWEDYAPPTNQAAGPWDDFKPKDAAGGNPRLQSQQEYSDIANDPNSGILSKAAQIGWKGTKELASGAAGAIGGMASAAGNAVMHPQDTLEEVGRKILPSEHFPMPMGGAIEDTAKGMKDAYDLAKQGRYSDAAKKLPIVGGAYDYATNHPIMETIGNVGTQALVAKGASKLVSKLGEVPKSVFGEQPAIKEQMGILKPANAKHALEDYPMVNARLLREHPELASGKATLPEIDEALDESMTQNRYYERLHTGPAKSAGMPVNLAPIASAIRNSITPLMRQEADAHVTALEKLADKYDKVGSISDVESFLRETNAKVADMRKLNPGDWAQAKNASDTKRLLDATNKSFKETYYKALELFNGSDATRMLNKEYGAMMGYRQDLADLVQRELTADHPPTGGSKIIGAAKAVVSPKKFIANTALNALEPTADRISRFAKTFKDFKGAPAPDYPAPPVRQGPGGGPGSPGNIAAGAYPGAAGKPAGPAQPLPVSRQLGAAPGPPLVTPPPPDTSGVYSRAPQGINVHPGTSQKLLGPATPGQPAPLVTPPPVDTSGAVPPGSTPPGMGVSAGRKVATAEGQFHPPSEHGPGTTPQGYTWVKDRGQWVLTDVQTLGHQMGPGKPLPKRTK